MKILAPSSKLLGNLFPEAQYAEIPMDSAFESFQWDDITCANPVCFEVYGTNFPKVFDFDGYGILEEYSGSSQFDRLRNWRGPAVFALALNGRGFHGQYNREWRTKAGNLFLSMAIPCNLPVSVAEKLQILPAQILVSLIRPKLKPCFQCDIKQPNDVVIMDGTSTCKIAGILTEMRVSSSLITQVRYGLGLNLVHAPEHLENAVFPAISLRDVTSDVSKMPPIRYLHLSRQFRSMLHDILVLIPERLHALSSEKS